jgi:lipopolysaccharide/colanic/teichoic acid biosynthesis glycosyltransferase
LDLVVATVALLGTLPLMALIALLIVCDSGRPVFYRQDRVGARLRRRGGRLAWEERTFRILKFRTMVRDADRQPLHEEFVRSYVAGSIDADTQSADGYKLDADPRVTRVGALLRRTSLDELPQLWNVLTGSMSLVGPRPVPPYEVALYEPAHRERLAALPGITGAWQVAGRGRVGFEEMVRMDIEYVRQQSLTGDLSLLLRTIPAIFSARGAK